MVSRISKKPGAPIATADKTALSDNIAISDVAATDAPKVIGNGANAVRRKEMVERIVASSGLKPNAVKSVLDAVLAELGNALSAGEALNLHPLGKVTVNRQKNMGDREILICKIRRKLTSAQDEQPLNSAAE